jgi:protein TonB
MAPWQSGQPTHGPQLLGTSASVAAHLVIFAVVLLVLARGTHENAATIVSIVQFNHAFFNRPDPGGPGGGGGDEIAAPARRQIEMAPARRRDFTPTATPVDTPPDPAFSIPTTTIQPVKTLPGGLSEIDSRGPGFGAGPGGGSGAGAGIDGGVGPGFGPGRLGGAGGDVFGTGGGVTAPVLVHEVRPAYTVNAMRAKLQGIVEMEVVVLPDGSVDPARIRVTRSLDATFGLDREAVAAVRQWRFRPGRFQGQAVPVRVNVELTFSLR